MTEPQIHPTAQVMPGASLGEGVVIGPRSVIGENAIIDAGTRIGSDTRVFPGAVLGRVPMKATSGRGRPVLRDLPSLSIGSRCVIGSCAVIYRGTTIGRRCLIGDNASIREEVTIGAETLIAMGVTINYGARLGKRVRIMDNSHITGFAIIEDDVFISTHVATTNDNVMGRIENAELRGPTIATGASLGANCTLLPGVRIGRRAVVAAGAVVTDDVEDGVLVLGVPARKRQ